MWNYNRRVLIKPLISAVVDYIEGILSKFADKHPMAEDFIRIEVQLGDRQ